MPPPSSITIAAPPTGALVPLSRTIPRTVAPLSSRISPRLSGWPGTSSVSSIRAGTRPSAVILKLYFPGTTFSSVKRPSGACIARFSTPTPSAVINPIGLESPLGTAST